LEVVVGCFLLKEMLQPLVAKVMSQAWCSCQIHSLMQVVVVQVDQVKLTVGLPLEYQVLQLLLLA
jgi:hypothetical protein